MTEQKSKISPEIIIAQKLAGNVGKIRLKALTQLRSWLKRKSNSKKGFKKEDFIKLWKGLYYCLWMQDKPLLQEDLADRLSELIHCLEGTDNVILFMRVFYKTLNREWYGLDQWRIDKYLMFMRRFLRQSLEWVRNQQWSEQSIRKFCNVLEEEVYEVNRTDVPDAIQYHVCTIFVEEMCRVAGEELTPKATTLLLRPFMKVLAQSKNKLLCNEVRLNVFEHLIRLSDVGQEEEVEEARKELFPVDEEEMQEGSDTEEEEDEEGASEEEEEEEKKVSRKARRRRPRKQPINFDKHYRQLVGFKMTEALAVPESKFDFGDIAEKLFEYGRNPKVHQENRLNIYKLVKVLQEAAEGKFPLDKVPEVKMKGLRRQDYLDAEQKLLKARTTFGSEMEELEISECEDEGPYKNVRLATLEKPRFKRKKKDKKLKHVKSGRVGKKMGKKGKAGKANKKTKRNVKKSK